MTLEDLRRFALSLPGTTEDMPFGPDILVLRLHGKIFMLITLDVAPLRINLKCDPSRAVELRALYPQITPGWHMNKKHWNSVTDLELLPRGLVRSLISHSYNCVLSSLPMKERRSLYPVEESYTGGKSW